MDIVRVKLVRESQIEYNTKLTSPDAVASFLYSFIGDEPQENFVVISVSSKGDILNATKIAIGTVNQAIIHPRDVFRTAVMSNASSIIIAHNHPSGDPTPSKNDIDVTHMLLEGAKVLDIQILDHIIVGYDRYYSLKEKGII